MQEVLNQIFIYARIMWRYRLLSFVVAWVVCIAGWVVVYTLPDQYESSAKIQVDTGSILGPLLKGLTVNTNVTEKVTMMTRVMLSRPYLEKLARQTDLDLRASTPRQLERLITGLQNRITIKPPQLGSGRRKKEFLYRISYMDRDPVKAQKVVQYLVTSLVEDALGANRLDSGSAQKFLATQIQEYEVRLTNAETRLADFKKKNVGQMPGQGGGYYERLQKALELLETNKSELKLAINKRNVLRKQLRGESVIIDKRSKVSAIDSDIEKYKTELDALSLKYTDVHPDIQALKVTIAQLEKRKQLSLQQESKILKGKTGKVDQKSLQANPVYQNVKIALSDAEVAVETIRAKVLSVQKKINSLKKFIDVIPEVEAELKRLNRDYSITKSKYEALLARMESAKLSEDVGRSSGDIKFKVIEPPTVSLTPVGPKRLLLITAVLGAAIGLGLGVAFLLSQLKQVFVSTDEIRKITGLPVLGFVSVVRSKAEERKIHYEYIIYSSIFGILLVSYGGVIFFAAIR